ncbi:hypothetical protein [Herbiconiux solani]|uniref:hypothetical protein n=1 Tax=Herbiconiux solani TaxID=661329 RepID=UPI0012EDC172|nr:hypothetical protein [Herbiconiux solani]
MSSGPGYAGEAAEARIRLQRSVVIWSGLLILTVAALFAAVGILNRELFSASAFVRIYLQELGSGDVAAAVDTPGVVLESGDEPGTGAAVLVNPDAINRFHDITEVSDTQILPGRHRIVYSYVFDGIDGKPVPGQTEFDVVQTGSTLLVFPQWEFFRSPVAQGTVTVTHASDFTAGGLEIASADASAFRASDTYDVLVPALITLGHRSRYLGANPVALTATNTGTSTSAIVQVQPTTGFLDAVQSTVNGFLDECASQALLYPPGCPFGLDVNDRIASEPSWTMEKYPMLTILAGHDSWIVPTASGSAHIAVDIRSLFDGTVSTRDESVPFDVTFALTIQPDGSIGFAPRG